jgi:riboflavin kinase
MFSKLREFFQFLPLKPLSDTSQTVKVVHKDIEKQPQSHTLYYTSFLRVPYRALQNLLCLRGPVASGYGRGGKKLGIPTANLPESLFANALIPLQAGVYFGWALIEGSSREEKSLATGRNVPCKAVVNVGYSPTFVGKENREKIVEAHLMDVEIEGDFYNETMRLFLVGSLRPEKKFASFTDLLSAIHFDIQCAKEALLMKPFSDFRLDPFLSAEGTTLIPWIGASGGNETASWEYEHAPHGMSK